MIVTSLYSRLEKVFQKQQSSFALDPYPSAERRIDRLRRAKQMLRENREVILNALEEDFGGHSREMGELIEIIGVINRAEFNIRNVQGWMEPVLKETDPAMSGESRAWVQPQPKGVVGNMVSWNFPFDIGMGPTLDALAAGNRVIIKPSDLSPACGRALEKMVAQTFDDSEVAVVNGDVEFARRFPTLPWDHLVFTGSTAIGREVMRAAAENLVPVTLELGGKCPAIVDAAKVQDKHTISTIAGVKAIKRGQMCVSVDYCLVPAGGLEAFTVALTSYIKKNFTLENGAAHMCGIISERHLTRLRNLVDDAKGAGATVIEIGDPAADPRHMPFHVIVDPPDTSAVMREEVFGPILPVITYASEDEIVERVRRQGRPLGVYVFSDDQKFIDLIARRTVSGGFAVNAAAAQASLPSMGFGGVGSSGMGRHHGKQGFLEFSNTRGYFARGQGGMMDFVVPPYGDNTRLLINHAYSSGSGTTQ